MSNKHDEIKKLIKASRHMIYGDSLNESVEEIKRSHGLLFEENSIMGVGNQVTNRDNIGKSIEKKIEYTVSPEEEKKQSYRVSGGIITLHGKDKQDLELTTDEKAAFQETMDEFVAEVSDLADFGKLNVYVNNVEWSGHIIDADIDFFYSINESNGIYIKGEMMKVDKDFLDLVNKLQTFYQKFKGKWAKIVASRKKSAD